MATDKQETETTLLSSTTSNFPNQNSVSFTGGIGGTGPSPSTSRSGRVRKKNSFLADFESLEDHLDKPKKFKHEKSPKITPKTPKKEPPPERLPPPRPPSPDIVQAPQSIPQTQTSSIESQSQSSSDEIEVSELEIDLPEEFNEADMPMLAAEEIIDEGLLEAEEAIEIPLGPSRNNNTKMDPLSNIDLGLGFGSSQLSQTSSSNSNRNGTNSKLKSQAQSTYMLEKPKPSTGGTKSKGGSGSGGPANKSNSISNSPLLYPLSKIPKKKSSLNSTNPPDKPGRRVTAYQLWTKEQRTNFTERFPHLDTSQFSKKLGELWSEIPQAQKKMWKNRAAKMMKGNENMKNTLPQSKKSRSNKNNPNNSQTQSNTKGKGKKQPKIKNSSPDGSIIAGTSKSPNKSNKSRKKVIKNPNLNDLKGIVPPPKKLESINEGGSPGVGGIGSPITPSVSGAKGKGRGTGNKKTELFKNGGGGKSFTNTNFKGKGKVNRSPVAASGSAMMNNHVGLGIPKIQRKEEEHVFKVTGTNPIDLASHFALLGESLSVIGQRLKEHEGQNVSGSLSVLLDSLLCATGPLLCLTQQVNELNAIPEPILRNTLDNIAYIMPGI